jgi:hypothetical protein
MTFKQGSQGNVYLTGGGCQDEDPYGFVRPQFVALLIEVANDDAGLSDKLRILLSTRVPPPIPGQKFRLDLLFISYACKSVHGVSIVQRGGPRRLVLEPV